MKTKSLTFILAITILYYVVYVILDFNFRLIPIDLLISKFVILKEIFNQQKN